MSLRAVDLIAAKKGGAVHAPEEIAWFVEGYVAGRVPEYQMAAWLMAVCFQGLDTVETCALTRALWAGGRAIDFSDLAGTVADKHSTGGVGDKVTLVLAPLVASCGLPFAKMSGRGLAYTGGTIDKLESIPGFRTELDVEAFRAQVRRVGLAVVGQTADLAPGDRLLYALRDATATVAQPSLIAASVMSKKIAAGAAVIALDIKVGEGAFVVDRFRAEDLARLMIGIGEEAGRKVRCLLTAMDEPLGRAVGNALEVEEALAVLSGEGPDDVRDVVLRLGAMLLEMGGIASAGSSLERARRALDSGAARETWARWIRAQGGDPDVLEDGVLPRAPIVHPMRAPRAGWLRRVRALSVAQVCLGLGAGRSTKGARIDHGVGVVLEATRGAHVAEGDIIAWIHARTPAAAEEADTRLRAAFQFDDDPPEPRETVIGYV